MWDQSAWNLVQRGGPIMWPLVALSVFGLALILDRLLAFAWNYQHFDSFLRRLRPLGEQADWNAIRHLCRGNRPFQRIARRYAELHCNDADVRRDVVQREGNLVIQCLETRLRWLGIIGKNSPLLGLLGTVTGLVSAFHTVEVLGGQVQPSDLANGIWEALLTTVFGLAVSLPCLVVYNALQGRVESVSRQLSILVSYLDEWRAESVNSRSTTGSPEAHASGTPSR